MMKEKYTQLIDQLRRDLMQKNAEIEEAKSQVEYQKSKEYKKIITFFFIYLFFYANNQVISKQKLELLKLEFGDEYDSPYKKKLIVAEEELEVVRAELTKLKYDFSFLKSEYEHQVIVFFFNLIFSIKYCLIAFVWNVFFSSKF